MANIKNFSGTAEIDMNTYHVLNEHTLGYVNAARPEAFEVLAGKPQLGGHNWINGSVVISRLDVMRPAAMKDFEFFRVSPTGHIN